MDNEYDYCESCKHSDVEAYFEPCVSCRHTYTGVPTKLESPKKPQTHADRIRAMSDEELARFLAENEWECETYNDCAKCPRMTDDGCVSLSKWLKQPVED